MKRIPWLDNRLIVAACALLLGTGCRDASAPSFSDLLVTTAVSRTEFSAGDTILVTVTVRNVGSQPRTSVSEFDAWCDGPPFVVLAEDGSEVGPDRTQYEGCLQILDQAKVLAPGEEVAFTSRWNGSATDASGTHTLLPPETYRVQSALLANTDATIDEPATVAIRD